MSIIPISILFVVTSFYLCNTVDILPWERYLQLGDVERPLGLIYNQSSVAHHHFMIGYLCLHSFMYDTAQEAFDLAIDLDPTLIEAHIGKLLGHKQPLWSYTNRSGALEVWNNTWSLFDEYNVSLTTFQSTYMNTVYQWFVHENTSDGEEAFLTAMIHLTTQFPSNNDAQTLLGVAYLNQALRQSAELKMMEPPALLTARKILQTALVNEPTHPGCLHYLIHAFDVPRVESAVQAVPYAHKYGQVVFTASHAQHMPTHIWTRIGVWSLAQTADARSIEVSLSLCIIKQQQQSNDTQLDTNEISSLTLSKLITRLNLTQSEDLLHCDRDNRAHSQVWLVYSYLQTGRYRRSASVLADLVLSNQIYPFDNYYLPFIYGARAFIVTNVFFWAMYEKEINQEIFVRTINEVLIGMDPNPIHTFNDSITDSSFLVWSEALARFVECIRLLLVNVNDTTNGTSVEYHLSRMSDISTTIKSTMESTSIRILIMISQINALRWCFNGSMENCLIELDKTSRLESSFGNDHNRPNILHIHSSELFAFYLLLTHRHYNSLSSTYILNNITIRVTDFPSYALYLYAIANRTDPHRAVNSLGMARCYAQMGRSDQAKEIYETFLREWSDSTFSSNIDRIVIEEATNYLLATKINQIKNNGCILHFSSFVINFLFVFLFVNSLNVKHLFTRN